MSSRNISILDDLKNASPLEDLERLEQLRLIEAGHTIATFKVEGTSLSVDTPEQLDEARRLADCCT